MSGETVYVAGAYEHPTREAPEKSTEQLHAEAARGALDDAGVAKDEVDGYFTANVPEYGSGMDAIVMADYLGLDLSTVGGTDVGGSSYVSHVGHAVDAIRNGKCDVALVTFAGRPRSAAQATGTGVRELQVVQDSFEKIYGSTIIAKQAMRARRHVHEFDTTEAQLAEIRAAASHHAQYNEHAVYRDPVTVEDVLASPTVSDPIKVLDCCLISDGAGAVVVVSEAVRDELECECVEILGHGEYVKHGNAGRVDVTYTGARYSGPRAYEEAGIGPEDVDYASIYDAFTILVLNTIEDLGFCEKGDGGAFVEGGTLKAPDGELPFNTDGGGLCNNHPNRGGMFKILEAVRQLRGETAPEVQVPDCEIALAHGTGGGTGGHCSVTLVLGRDSR